VIRQFVLSASVGGAAAAPADRSVWVAPIRDVEDIAEAEQRAALEPADAWDPWPARRIGYGPDGDLLFPPRARMDRLCRYLGVR
jgi:hypothetical protein